MTIMMHITGYSTTLFEKGEYLFKLPVSWYHHHKQDIWNHTHMFVCENSPIPGIPNPSVNIQISAVCMWDWISIELLISLCMFSARGCMSAARRNKTPEGTETFIWADPLHRTSLETANFLVLIKITYCTLEPLQAVKF